MNKSPAHSGGLFPLVQTQKVAGRKKFHSNEEVWKQTPILKADFESEASKKKLYFYSKKGPFIIKPKTLQPIYSQLYQFIRNMWSRRQFEPILSLLYIIFGIRG